MLTSRLHSAAEGRAELALVTTSLLLDFAFRDPAQFLEWLVSWQSRAERVCESLSLTVTSQHIRDPEMLRETAERFKLVAAQLRLLRQKVPMLSRTWRMFLQPELREVVAAAALVYADSECIGRDTTAQA